MPDIEVGKVMIRVSPDTDRFREDTAAGVKSELAGYKPEVPVGADTDFSDVGPKAKAAAKAARQKVDFDGETAFNKQITGMGKRFDSIMNRRVAKVPSNIMRETEAIGKRFDSIMDQRIGKFNSNFQQWQRQNEQAARDAQKTAEIEAKAARDKLAAEEKARQKNSEDARKDAQALNKKGVDSALRIQKIEKETNRRRSASLAAFAEGGVRVGSMFKKLIPSFGSGINFGGYLAIIGAIILLAAPLIGIISSAILAISGLIAMIVTPIAAIALGMKGIVKAAEDSGLLNVFRKDGKKNKYGAGKAVDDIGKKVNEAFEKGLTAPFKKLADAIPNLLQSLPKVATGLSDMMSGFIDALTSEEGTRLFDKTVQNIADAMSASAPGVEAFTNGFLKLTTAFTNKLPGLSSWFNTTGEGFEKWVDKFFEVDPAEGWWGESEFDKIFDGLGGFLKMLGDFFVDLGKTGLEFLQDKDKMNDFIESFKNLGEAIDSFVGLGNKMDGMWEFFANLQTFLEWLHKWAYAIGVPGVSEFKADPEPEGPVSTSRGPGAEVRAIEEAEKQRHEDWSTHEGNTINPRVWAERLDPRNWFDSGWGDRPFGETEVNQFIGVGPDGKPTANAGDMRDSYEDKIKEIEEAIQQAENKLENGGRSFLENAVVGAKELLDPTSWGWFPETLEGEIARLREEAKQLRSEFKEAANNLPKRELSMDVAPKSSEKPLQTGWWEGEDIPAPDTSQFDSAVNELPITIGNAGDGVNTAAQKIASDIEAAVAGLYGVGQEAGEGFGRGLLEGLGVHEGSIQAKAASLANTVGSSAQGGLEENSPSLWAFRLGGWFGDGLILGLGDKEEDVGAAAGQLSDKVLSGMGGPGDTRNMLENTPWTGAQSQRLKEVNKEYKELNQTLRFLNADLDAANDAGDVAIQQEIDRVKEIKKRLKVEKDALSLHREALGLDEKEKEQDIKASDYLNKAIGAGKDFAMANYTTFQSDLGISGSGAISMGVSEGINWAMGAMSNLVSSGMKGMGGNIVVNNVDDAVAAKNNQVNKQKKQYATR